MFKKMDMFFNFVDFRTLYAGFLSYVNPKYLPTLNVTAKQDNLRERTHPSDMLK